MNLDACWTCQAPEGHTPDCAYVARRARLAAFDARVDALLALWPGTCRCHAEEQVRRDDTERSAMATPLSAEMPSGRPRGA